MTDIKLNNEDVLKLLRIGTDVSLLFPPEVFEKYEAVRLAALMQMHQLRSAFSYKEDEMPNEAKQARDEAWETAKKLIADLPDLLQSLERVTRVGAWDK